MDEDEKKLMDEDEKKFIDHLDELNRLCTGYGLSDLEEYYILQMYRLQKYHPLSEIVMERKGSMGLSHRKGWLKKINYDKKRIKRTLRKRNRNV